MSKPTAEVISRAIGVSANQVSVLAKRGMPVHQTKKAKEWFDKNGFGVVNHSKTGAGSINRPALLCSK